LFSAWLGFFPDCEYLIALGETVDTIEGPELLMLLLYIVPVWTIIVKCWLGVNQSCSLYGRTALMTGSVVVGLTVRVGPI